MDVLGNINSKSSRGRRTKLNMDKKDLENLFGYLVDNSSTTTLSKQKSFFAPMNLKQAKNA